jgi:hypothetical protein
LSLDLGQIKVYLVVIDVEEESSSCSRVR